VVDGHSDIPLADEISLPFCGFMSGRINVAGLPESRQIILSGGFNASGLSELSKCIGF